MPPRLVARTISFSREVEGKGLLPSAMHLEGEHPAEVAHLPAGNRVAWIAGQARIVNHRNGGVSGQVLRHPAGILAMQAHARHQRLQPTQNEPAVKWGKDRAAQPVGTL